MPTAMPRHKNTSMNHNNVEGLTGIQNKRRSPICVSEYYEIQRSTLFCKFKVQEVEKYGAQTNKTNFQNERKRVFAEE